MEDIVFLKFCCFIFESVFEYIWVSCFIEKLLIYEVKCVFLFIGFFIVF